MFNSAVVILAADEKEHGLLGYAVSNIGSRLISPGGLNLILDA